MLRVILNFVLCMKIADTAKYTHVLIVGHVNQRDIDSSRQVSSVTTSCWYRLSNIFFRTHV
jgi:hypothetical protein